MVVRISLLNLEDLQICSVLLLLSVMQEYPSEVYDLNLNLLVGGGRLAATDVYLLKAADLLESKNFYLISFYIEITILYFIFLTTFFFVLFHLFWQ